MCFRTRRFLDISRLRPQRLSTPKRAEPAASHTAPGGSRVERDVMITGAYSPETTLSPPSYCLQPSSSESFAKHSTSVQRAALDTTTTVKQVNDSAPPPIPEKSTARLSTHRKSWGPTTTVENYMDFATQAPTKSAATKYNLELRYSPPLLQDKELSPCFPPPLFFEDRGIPPIQEVVTPVSSNSSAQHSPGMLRWSPRWNRWPQSSTNGPSPPISPVQDLLESPKPPPMWESRYSDHYFRHYSF